MRIVIVLKGTLSVHALNYVTSLVMLRSAYVGRRSCRRYVRNTLRNKLVVRFTAILTYLSAPLHHTIIVSHIRFTPVIFAVPMWGSEVANTEIHLTNTPSEETWACDVTTVEREGDFTLLGMCYCVWYWLSGDHANGRRHEITCVMGLWCGLPQC